MTCIKAKPKAEIKVQVRSKMPINLALKPKPKINITVASGFKEIGRAPELPALTDLITSYQLGRL